VDFLDARCKEITFHVIHNGITIVTIDNA